MLLTLAAWLELVERWVAPSSRLATPPASPKKPNPRASTAERDYRSRADDMDEALIKEVRKRAANASRATDDADVTPVRVFPVASADDIAEAQRALGFELPTLLKELYLQVGNGGYGPGYGLVGIAGGATDDMGKSLVALYAGFAASDPDDVHWRWPQRLLPVAHLGCAMYACIDCSTVEGRVVWFEPNPHSDGERWDDSFIALAPSMSQWLQSWLAGENLLEGAWKAKFGETPG